MSNEPEGQFPQVPFALHELEALEWVLWAYGQYLQKAPVTAKNTEKIQIVKQLQERLAAQLTSNTEQVQLLLTIEELQTLVETMADFATLIERIFPHNQERNSVIESVNLWRLRLLHILSEFET